MSARDIRAILAACGIVALVTVIARAADLDLTAASLLLLAAVIVASFLGLAPAIVAAALAFAALNVVFTPPTGSLTIAKTDDVVALVIFAVTALLLGWLFRALGLRAQILERREREAQLRLRLTSRLLEGADLDESLQSTVASLREIFDFRACALHVGERGASSGEFTRTADVSVSVENVTLDALTDDGVAEGDEELLEALVAGIAASADRLRLQEEVRDAKLVAEIGRQRAGFLSAVSHNLRTPLTAVKAAAGTLLSSWSRIEPEERRELLETIADEAERLERLVRNTLELSRIRAGALDVELEPVDIPDLVQHAVRRLRPIARAHRVRLDVPDNLPTVWLDVTMLDQILLNLLENALSFAPPGSEILVSAAAVDDEHVELRVVDHGPGVPPDAQVRIFEEFQSVDTRPDRPATGLGLAIVRALVTAHGGTVRYRDTPGGGATFVCTFPRRGEVAA